MPARSLKNATLVIEDGAGSPNSLEIPIEDGNLQWDDIENGVVVKHRGVVTEWIDAEGEPVPFSFDAVFEEWTGKTTTGTPSPRDALRKSGQAAAWTSTSSSGPYTFTLKYTIADTEASGGQNERVTLTKAKAESLQFTEGYPNKLSVRGRALSISAARAV